MVDEDFAQKKKSVLKSIGALAELDSADFKKGVVDMLKLLYDQDVSMTNIIAERLEKVEIQLNTLNGFMLALHVAVSQQMQEGNLRESTLREISAAYELDYEKIKDIVNENSLTEIIKSMKKYFQRLPT